jgi:hypothetical protein
VAATSGVKLNFGLASLALFAFMAGFFGARIFTTLRPDTVVVSGGIHFHHFWYGLAMVVVAGWLGIVSVHPTMNRIYATLFGFGGGLIGDEFGLLLTFGDYHSELTYVGFVGFVCIVSIVLFVFRYRELIRRDLTEVTRGETLVHAGVIAVGFSTLFFSFGYLGWGAGVALVGAVVVVSGEALRRRSRPALKSA